MPKSLGILCLLQHGNLGLMAALAPGHHKFHVPLVDAKLKSTYCANQKIYTVVIYTILESTIHLFDIMALFDIFLETNKHENLMTPGCPLRFVGTDDPVLVDGYAASVCVALAPKLCRKGSVHTS